jgi:hypothetical protein
LQSVKIIEINAREYIVLKSTDGRMAGYGFTVPSDAFIGYCAGIKKVTGVDPISILANMFTERKLGTFLDADNQEFGSTAFKMPLEFPYELFFGNYNTTKAISEARLKDSDDVEYISEWHDQCHEQPNYTSDLYNEMTVPEGLRIAQFLKDGTHPLATFYAYRLNKSNPDAITKDWKFTSTSKNYYVSNGNLQSPDALHVFDQEVGHDDLWSNGDIDSEASIATKVDLPLSVLQLFCSMGHLREVQRNVIMQQPHWNNRSVHEKKRVSRDGLFGVVSRLKKKELSFNANSIVLHPYQAMSTLENEYSEEENGYVSVLSFLDHQELQQKNRRAGNLKASRINKAFERCFDVPLTDVFDYAFVKKFHDKYPGILACIMMADFAFFMAVVYHNLDIVDEWISLHKHIFKKAFPGMWTEFAKFNRRQLPHIIYECIVAFQSLHSSRNALIDGAGRCTIWRLAYQMVDVVTSTYLQRHPDLESMAVNFTTYIMVGQANNTWGEKYALRMGTFSMKVQSWNEQVQKRNLSDLLKDFVHAMREFQASNQELFYLWELEKLQPYNSLDASKAYVAQFLQMVHFIAEKILDLSYDKWPDLYEWVKKEVSFRSSSSLTGGLYNKLAGQADTRSADVFTAIQEYLNTLEKIDERKQFNDQRRKRTVFRNDHLKPKKTSKNQPVGLPRVEDKVISDAVTVTEFDVVLFYTDALLAKLTCGIASVGKSDKGTWQSLNVLIALIGPCATVPEKILNRFGFEHPFETLSQFCSSWGHPACDKFDNTFFRVKKGPQHANSPWKRCSRVTFPSKDTQIPDRGFMDGAIQSSSSSTDLDKLFGQNLHYSVWLPQQLLLAMMLHVWHSNSPSANKTNKRLDNYVISRQGPLVYSSVLQMYNTYGMHLPLDASLRELAPTIFRLLTTNPFQDASIGGIFKKVYGNANPFASNLTEFILILTVVAGWQNLKKLSGVTKVAKKKKPKKIKAESNKGDNEESIDLSVDNSCPIEFGFFPPVMNKNNTNGQSKFIGLQGAPTTAWWSTPQNEKKELFVNFLVSRFRMECWEEDYWCDIKHLPLILYPNRVKREDASAGTDLNDIPEITEQCLRDLDAKVKCLYRRKEHWGRLFQDGDIFQLYYKKGSAEFFNLATEYHVKYPHESERGKKGAAKNDDTNDDDDDDGTTRYLDLEPYKGVTFSRKECQLLAEIKTKEVPDELINRFEQIAKTLFAASVQMQMFRRLAEKKIDFATSDMGKVKFQQPFFDQIERNLKRVKSKLIAGLIQICAT